MFYGRSGLFHHLNCFRELEAKIAALTTEKERGDAFEVFAEAYFATQPVEKAKQVLPFTAIPPSLRQKLGLHSKDVGVDGIVETFTGTYRAYQVKFRSRRDALTWRDTATFFGLADRFDERLLFTNSEDVSEVAEQRRDFSSIRGTDLDRLEARDFDAIQAWLAGEQVVRKKKTPWPHQVAALKDILPALRQADRATAIMACGTGKTQLSLWVAEAIAKRTVLVLVPSLALLRQTLKEWINETKWESYDYLCVCSDPTVSRGEDDLIMRPTELEFSVSTEPAQVRKFLSRPFKGVKIVFSTYQSADVVAGGMRRGDAFDIGIFDEAHKTAGREGAKFSFALMNKNLPIRKRLFLTATPRHYNLQQRDARGDPIEVFSMDRPEVYGQRVHTLTFAQAALQGIICRYKVVISVVTSQMLDHHQLRHGTVLVKGAEIRASQVANQIALAQAVQRHKLKKIFTFHRSVESARSFTGEGSEGVGNHLRGFATFHVNGAMPTADRDGLMDEFRAASQAVMSNARCLTEGIDVPTVDMVAFLTPKRSKVDIVQATGRAMRRADGKTTGYILVPLFVQQAKGESLDEAINRADFDEVWAVLQAMQEQDEVLDDCIHFILAGKKQIKGFDESRIRERVEVIGPNVSISKLRRAISTRCFTRLGRPWDTMVQQLLLFKKRFGNCRVPKNPRRPWKDLGQWVDAVRALKRNRHLPLEREDQLNTMGFDWRVEGQTLDDTTGLLNELQFARACGWANNTIATYRKQGLIQPVGKALSATQLSCFYHPRQVKALKRKLGVTLESTKGLLSEKPFIKASGLTAVADYRKRGLIKPVGYAIGSSGLIPFYHPRQIKALKRKLGVTLESTKGLLSGNQFIKVSGLTKVGYYRKRGLIKPVGYAIGSTGLIPFYHPRQIKALKRKLGITLESTKGLLNEKQFIRASGLTQIAKYRKRGLIRSVGKAMAGPSVSSFYHPRQIKILKRGLGITLVSTKGLLTENQFIKASGLTRVVDYRKQGLIQPVGKALSATQLSCFYHPHQVKALKRKLGVTLESTKGLLTENQCINTLKLTQLPDYRQQGLIKPVGNAVTNSGLTFFYHPRQFKELKRKLGVTLESTKGLLSEKKFIKASGLTQIAKYRKRGLIKPVGKAYSATRRSYFYHPRQIKELKRKLAALKSQRAPRRSP
jgi:superfamily II DNA or RNA helicase